MAHTEWMDYGCLIYGVYITYTININSIISIFLSMGTVFTGTMESWFRFLDSLAYLLGV